MDRGRRIWTVVAAALFSSVVAVVPFASPAAANPSWIDTWDRDGVLASWAAEFDRAEPAMEFTGDVATCTAGTTSQAFRDSVLQRVNWYRRMAGLDTVVENSMFSGHNQQAAVMMAAQGALSHSPGGGWACHTPDGASAAGKSNLALGLNGVEAIDAYMQDWGATNTTVGHRRTMLYPQVQEMGTGDVPFASGSWSSNTLHVFDSNLWNPRPDLREERDFVAWPPAGYVPAETVWGRWSFSLARADFSTASVAVTGPDGPVQVEILERIQADGLIAPEASIVFAVDGDNNSAPFPTPVGGDDCYDVSVAGVTMAGSVLAPFDYTTCVLDPAWSPDPVAAPGIGTTVEVCPGLSYSAWDTPCWNSGNVFSTPFSDVSTPWQITPVAWLVANDITTGVSPTRFAPDGAVTRAQAATLVWRLAGSPAPPADAPTFTDVPAGSFYETAVRWMAGHGITTGKTATLFDPNGPATRAEMVAFLWRLVDQPVLGDAGQFTDVTAAWQQGPVGWAATAGITTGTSATTFDPDSPVTRGQAAALLQRLADSLSS